jgi:filamentous hemagglutinin family protein
MNKYLLPWFQISFFTCFSLLTNNSVTAQSISSDGTLPTPTEVTPTATGVEINGGTTKEGNLFHSFKDFSVPTGSEAFFNNAPDVVNILNRVTGGNISSIDGLLRANGSANLFLINPAGIVFGEGASLDIGGSFYGSTADSILFPDRVEFSATDTQAEPILTINAPIGLNFRDNPAPIVNNSKASANLNPSVTFDDNTFGLRVPDGKTFALAGGNITANGGGIVAFGGRIELAAVGGQGTLTLVSNGNSFSFDFSENLPRADVSLTNNAGFLVAGSDGGDIAITARNINILEDSSLSAGIFFGLGSPNAQAGDITVNTTGIVTLNNGSIFNFVGSDAIGNGGNINIKAKSLNVSNTGQIIATTFGQGDTGSVNILAKETVSFDGRDETDSFPSGIFVTVREGAIGNARDIKITTGSLKITNRAQLSSSTEGNGNAGNINIDAQNEISLSNSILISEVTEGLGMGDGGDITIETGSLLLQNGSALLADTENIGNAGDITIEARENVVLEGKGPAAQSGSLEDVPNQITATIDDFVGAVGEAGDINISTPFLLVTDEGFIRVSTFAQGDAGNIKISSDNIFIDNFGSIESDVRNANGIGGEIFLNTNSLTLENGASISAETIANSGTGGNINLNIDGTLLMRDNSLISAQAIEGANGGNVDINSNFLVAFPNQNNDIIASAEQGKGGNIQIAAESVLGIKERPLNPLTNDINASSEFGLDGNIVINTPDVDPFQETTEAPENIVEPDQVVAGVCDATQTAQDILAGRENTFVVNGRGGMPPTPIEPMPSETVLIEGKSVPLYTETQERALQEQYPPIMTSQGAIYPARGIVKNPDGTVLLTAYPTNNTQRVPNNSPNCGV